MTSTDAVLKDIELQTESTTVLPNSYERSEHESLMDHGSHGSGRPLPQQITLWKPSRCIIAFDIVVFLLALCGCLLGGLGYYNSIHPSTESGSNSNNPPSTDFESLRKSIEDLQATVAALSTRVSTVESSTTSLSSTTTSLSSVVSSLSGHLDSTVSTVSSQSQSIAAQSDQIVSVQSTISVLAASVHDLQVNGVPPGTGGTVPPGFVDMVESELSGLGSNVSLIQAAAHNIQSSLGDVQIEILHLQDVATDTQIVLASQSSVVTLLNQTVTMLAGNFIDTTSINEESLVRSQLILNRYAAVYVLTLPRFLNHDYLTGHDGRVFMWIGTGPDIKDATSPRGCNAGPNPGYRFGALPGMNTFTGLYTMAVRTGTSPSVGPFIDLNVNWAGNGVFLLNTDTAPTAVAAGSGSIAFTMRYLDPEWFVISMQGMVNGTAFECHNKNML